MKITLTRVVLPLAISLATSTAVSADIDGNKPLICSVAEVYECTLDEGCVDRSADSVEIPALFHVNFEAGEISGLLDDGSERRSKARYKEIFEQKLVMQGLEQGYENERDGSAWSLTITQDTLEMALTSSTDETGFVFLGSCEID